MTSDIDRLIEEYCSKYEQAETEIKRLELYLTTNEIAENDLIQGVLLPAVNELRYAGCHCTRSLLAENEEIKIDELTKAVRHCSRSIYDAKDAFLQFLLAECRSFKNDYRMVSIGDIVKSYQEDSLIVYEINRKVSVRNINLCPMEDMQQWQSDLSDILQKWNVAREELNKHLLAERKRIFYSRLSIIAITVTAIATLISCLNHW